MFFCELIAEMLHCIILQHKIFKATKIFMGIPKSSILSRTLFSWNIATEKPMHYTFTVVQHTTYNGSYPMQLFLREFLLIYCEITLPDFYI